MSHNLLSFKGRMRRKDYWISAFVAPIASFIVLSIIVNIVDPISHTVSIALSVLFFLLVIWHEIAENCRRCHDLGRSGWWQLIPFYGFALAFSAGNVGPNKYGPDPKASDPVKGPTFEGEGLELRRRKSPYELELEAIKAEREANAR